MPKQQFDTTADVFGVVKPDTRGRYLCPIKGCVKRHHANAKDFGRHLAVAHKIPSPKHDGASGKKRKKDIVLPELHIRFCPGCGYNILEAEQAAVLLRRGK